MIRCLPFATALLAATALTPALAQNTAQNTDVDSTIADVTVYRDGADIVRRAQVTVPAGQGVFVLDDLTADLDRRSLRIAATGNGGLELGGVTIDRIAVDSDTLSDTERQRIESEIASLEDERGVLSDTIAAAQLQRAYLESLAGVPPWLVAGRENAGDDSAADPQRVFDFIGDQITPLLDTIRETGIQQRDLDRRLADLRRQLDGQPDATLFRTRADISYQADAAFSGEIEVRYRVAAARWEPFYDVRLETDAATGAASVDLARRAEVTQTTGEDWSNVTLKLATARPGGATEAPEPPPLYVEVAPDMPAQAPALVRSQAESQVLMAAPMADGRVAREASAAAVETGFDVLYNIAGQVTVGANGEARTVLIGDETLDADLMVRTVPSLDPAAYLSADITVEDGGVVLPGRATLYRNGVLVGSSSLDLIVPGDAATIGFGVDDLVTVERIPVQDQRGERGLFQTSTTDLKDWTIRVTNRHDVSVDVMVIDRLPQSRDERIDILPLDTNTEPTATDVDGVPGLLAWQRSVSAGGIMDVRFGYEVRWPEGEEVIYR